jgi:hypothetical protein
MVGVLDEPHLARLRKGRADFLAIVCRKVVHDYEFPI